MYHLAYLIKNNTETKKVAGASERQESNPEMKKQIPILISVLMTPGMTYGAQNYMFGAGQQNSIGLYAGQGTGSGTLFKLVQPFLWEFEPTTVLMLQYSQPITLFRLPARQSVHVIQNIGYGSNQDLSFTALGISLDVSFINWRGFYLGFGVGQYMRDSTDRYVESRLVFGEKFFIGTRMSNNWSAEFFTLHFSNGNFTPINNGFNFTGLAINYSF